MAEWITEEGIGETRSLLIENDAVIAARLQWPGDLVAGTVHSARLVSKRGGARRGTVVIGGEREALVDQLPAGVTEGASGSIRITRGAIAERGRLKLPQTRWVDEALPGDATAPAQTGKRVPAFSAGTWEEVWHAASSGSIAFAGGEILCSPTPAMTVIDVDASGDGTLSPRELALATAPAIARALRWFDVGGSIGIDFPTLEAKADRRAVDDALADALDDWSHERTAMNGFGFVQLIARLEGPSLLHRFASSRVGMCARYALRVAERTEGAGVTLLTVHPALKAKLKPEWLDELRRRTGRDVRVETEPSLALEAPSAQVVSP